MIQAINTNTINYSYKSQAAKEKKSEYSPAIYWGLQLGGWAPGLAIDKMTAKAGEKQSYKWSWIFGIASTIGAWLYESSTKS